MASRTIYTGIFRAGFPHLSEPHAANANDDPKFSVQAMFPKTGVCPINNKPVCSWEECTDHEQVLHVYATVDVKLQ